MLRASWGATLLSASGCGGPGLGRDSLGGWLGWLSRGRLPVSLCGLRLAGSLLRLGLGNRHGPAGGGGPGGDALRLLMRPGCRGRLCRRRLLVGPGRRRGLLRAGLRLLGWGLLRRGLRGRGLLVAACGCCGGSCCGRGVGAFGRYGSPRDSGSKPATAKRASVSPSGLNGFTYTPTPSGPGAKISSVSTRPSS